VSTSTRTCASLLKCECPRLRLTSVYTSILKRFSDRLPSNLQDYHPDRIKLVTSHQFQSAQFILLSAVDSLCHQSYERSLDSCSSYYPSPYPSMPSCELTPATPVFTPTPSVFTPCITPRSSTKFTQSVGHIFAKFKNLTPVSLWVSKPVLYRVQMIHIRFRQLEMFFNGQTGSRMSSD
jgi:hypothetical protein